MMWMPETPSHEVFERGAYRSRFACDVHTHTLASLHAYSTIGECVTAAKEVGLELLGSTDHYSAMISSTHHIIDYQYFINFHMWPRVWDGVRVLRGCEADIVDLDGHFFGYDLTLTEGITGRKYKKPITLKEKVFENCDYVIASIHNQDFTHGASVSQTTEMFIKALEQPEVLILGHMGRAGVPFDVDAVLEAARDAHKLIEINEHSFSHQYPKARRHQCLHIAERCAELGCMISTGTDAHIATDIGRFDATAELLDYIHFPEDLIATASAERFMSLVPDMRS